MANRWLKRSVAGLVAATFAGWVAVTLVTFTPLSAQTDRRGSLLFPVSQWISAGVCNNVTATPFMWSLPTSNPAVSACQTGTNTQKATLDFADGSNTLSAQITLMLPSDWVTTGNVSMILKWYAGTATTGNVVWQVATVCVADGSTSDPAFNTASAVTDAAKGTVNQDNDATISSVTVTGCTAGALMYIKVFRDPTDVSDTMADTAHLRGIQITYRRVI